MLDRRGSTRADVKARSAIQLLKADYQHVFSRSNSPRRHRENRHCERVKKKKNLPILVRAYYCAAILQVNWLFGRSALIFQYGLWFEKYESLKRTCTF